MAGLPQVFHSASVNEVCPVSTAWFSASRVKPVPALTVQVSAAAPVPMASACFVPLPSVTYHTTRCSNDRSAHVVFQSVGAPAVASAVICVALQSMVAFFSTVVIS